MTRIARRLHKKDIRDATVTDLTLDLWEIFRQTEFVDVLRKQRWAFWTSHLQQRVITPILEEARAHLWRVHAYHHAHSL